VAEQLVHDVRCGVCGFDPSAYDVEYDVTSSADIVMEIVNASAEGLSDEQMADTGDGMSIAELVESLDAAAPDRLAVVHQGLHTAARIGALRVGLGAGPVACTGSVTALHSSDGGVPKTPIDRAAVTSSGVAGDRQDDRTHHGRPLQALCIWSQDVIDALKAEGHPINPGLAGENITVAGIDWASLRPGSRIAIGEIDVLISSYAIPCAKNAGWFTDRYFNRMHHAKHPGWSRLYGIPIGDGTISRDDPVIVLGLGDSA